MLQDPPLQRMVRQAAQMAKMFQTFLSGTLLFGGGHTCFWKDDERTDSQSNHQSTGAKAYGACLSVCANKVRLRQRVAKMR